MSEHLGEPTGEKNFWKKTWTVENLGKNLREEIQTTSKSLIYFLRKLNSEHNKSLDETF